MAVLSAFGAPDAGAADAELPRAALGVDLAGSSGVGILTGAVVADEVRRAVHIPITLRSGEGEAGASVAALTCRTLSVGGAAARVLTGGVDALAWSRTLRVICAERLEHAAVCDTLKSAIAIGVAAAARGLAISELAALI